ncbi:MAG: MBL fold metallo-hydrolase [Myxococcales bacterium]|nr:MBL fold metallo-hydrolase [Myxococcales bacterium]
MPQSWKLGQATITKIVEIEVPGRMTWIVPQATPEALLAERWLQPHFCTPVGKAILSIHSFVIELEGLCMVVDTCVGNDKPRDIAAWNLRQGTFLQDLTQAGFPPERVDRVMCTHLHVDHVGWNTRLVEGRWQPTFPNARYLFQARDLEHFLSADDAMHSQAVNDSVRPVLDAGLAQPVDSDHRVCDGVWLEPTPGHTPGHVSVHIRSDGHEAVITGDLMHHPVQAAHPDWASSADVDPDQALATRRGFIERYADTPTLILGTHFATPTAGRFVAEGDSHRFVVD